MKKRTIVLLLAALIIIMSVILAACDFGNNNSGTTKEKATLKSATVTMAESSPYAEYFENGEISLPIGVRADFSESDFVLKGKYSDNSTKKITTFSINSNRRSERLIVVDFIVGEKTVAQLNVNTAFESVSPIKKDNLTIVYSGEEIDILDRLQLEDGTKISDMIAENKIAISEFSTTKGTDVAIYSVQLYLSEGYVWVEDNQETRQIDISWEITPKVVTIPTVIGSGVFEYDGTEKTLPLDMHGFENVINFVNGGTDTRKGTVAGTYRCQVLINENVRNNYTFGEGHTSSEAVDVATWTINKKVLSIPTVSGKQADEDGLYHFTYTGEAILPTLTVGEQTLSCNIDETTGNAVYDAAHAVYTDGVAVLSIAPFDVEAYDAFSGNQYIALNENEAIFYHAIELIISSEYEMNYAWEGTDSSRYVIKFCIDRADASLPDDFVDNFKLKYVYTGLEDRIGNWSLQISPNDYLSLIKNGSCGVLSLFYGGFMIPDEVKAYLAGNNIAIYENINLPLGEEPQGNNFEFWWGENATFGEDSIAQAGTTYHFDLVYYKDREGSGSYNYNPIVVSNVEVEVIKGALGFISTWEPGVYLEDYDSAVFTMGESVKPEFTTDNSGNAKHFVISDNISLGTEDRFTGKSVVTLYSATGEEGTYEATNELSLPGYYRTTITLLFDRSKYVSYYSRGDDYHLADTFTYDWQILKRKFSVNNAGNLNTASADLTWESIVYYSDPYSGRMCGLETTAETILVKWRENESDAWQDVISYDPDVAGYYKAEITVGYDHTKFMMYTEYIPVEEKYTYGDVYIFEWNR